MTSVGYLYVSEHHLMHTDLKACMRDIIRANRPCVLMIRMPWICTISWSHDITSRLDRQRAW